MVGAATSGNAQAPIARRQNANTGPLAAETAMSTGPIPNSRDRDHHRCEWMVLACGFECSAQPVARHPAHRLEPTVHASSLRLAVVGGRDASQPLPDLVAALARLRIQRWAVGGGEVLLKLIRARCAEHHRVGQFASEEPLQ